MGRIIPQARLEALVDRHPVARLATLDAGQNIHQVPIVFARVGGLIWSAVDGKPKQGAELARIRNLRRESRVSLLIDAYDEDWSKLWWIRIDGRADIVEAQSAADTRVGDAVTALARKYPQYQHVAILREPATLIAIKPIKTSSWCADSSKL